MDPKKCAVCKEATPKYKCPKCCIKYCSVACFKSHKESSCHCPQGGKDNSPKTMPPQQTVTTPDICHDAEVDTSEDRVPSEKLQLLGDSDELKLMLENPHLRDIMKDLTTSSNPAITMEKCMQEPIFVEFADQCLKVVEDQNTPCLPEG